MISPGSGWGLSTVSSLQCFHTAGLVTGKASGPFFHIILQNKLKETEWNQLINLGLHRKWQNKGDDDDFLL